MEKGKNKGFVFLETAAPTPDQARPSDVRQVYGGRKAVGAAEARFGIKR
jgi:hypothetical protein